MLNRLLEYNYSAVGIFLFVILIKLLLYFTGITDSGEYDASLFRLFPSHTWLSGLLAALTSVLLGVLVLFNSEKHAKRNDFSFWLVLFFAIQLSFYGFYGFTVEYVSLGAFIVCLYFFSRGLGANDKIRSVTDCFNLAFVLGLGAMFAPHLVYLLPLFWLLRIVLNLASFRSFFVSLLGFILPFVIADTFIFVFYSDVAQYTHQYVLMQLQYDSFLHLFINNKWEQLANVGPLFLLVLSLYATFSRSNSYKTVVRDFNTINLVVLVYIVLITILGLMPAHLGMMLVFVPSSYFLSNFQSTANANWRSAFLVILLISGFISYPPVMNGIVSFVEMVF